MATALITGASSGIGRVLVDLFAKDHHDVVLVARREKEIGQIAEQVSKRFGVRALAMPLDLAKPGAARALFERTQSEDLAIDILANNAGFARYGKLHESDPASQSEMIAVNVTALVELTRLFAEPMVARGRGKILQVSSTAAFQPGPRMAVYYATKAFVLSFSEALAIELEGTGVTVTTLCPGPTRTAFMDVASYKATGIAEIAMMSAEDVARAGYKGLMAGERLVVAGVQNKITAMGAQLLPRGLALRLSAVLTKSRE